MSLALLKLAKDFCDGKLSADQFADQYTYAWRSERDNGTLRGDDGSLSECLSSIFCVADMYNPTETRREYEFDEAKTRSEVATLVSRLLSQRPYLG